MNEVEISKEKYHLYMENTNKNGLMQLATVKYTVYLYPEDLLFIKSRIISDSKMINIDGVGIVDCREIKRIIKVSEEGYHLQEIINSAVNGNNTC